MKNPLAYKTLIAALLALNWMAPMNATASPRSIEGAEWRLASVQGVGTLGGVKVTLKIDGSGNARGNGGCNSYGGAVEIDGSAVAFRGIMSTQKMCPGPRMDVERSYFSALKQAASYRIDGAKLSLLDASGAQLAELVSA